MFDMFFQGCTPYGFNNIFILNTLPIFLIFKIYSIKSIKPSFVFVVFLIYHLIFSLILCNETMIYSIVFIAIGNSLLNFLVFLLLRKVGEKK